MCGDGGGGGGGDSSGGYDPQADRGGIGTNNPSARINKMLKQIVDEQAKKDTGTEVAAAPAPAPDPVEKASATKETAPLNRPAQATPERGKRFYRSHVNYARFGTVGGGYGVPEH